MIRHKRLLLTTLALAACLLAPLRATASGPYGHLPNKGDTVHFDGSVGGETFGWAFYNEYWLQTYLSFTIEAARNPTIFAKSQAAVAAIGEHALTLPNGTRGVVEEVKTFEHAGREDVQVRVMVQDGDLRGSEVWTTAGELVDSAGKSYLKT